VLVSVGLLLLNCIQEFHEKLFDVPSRRCEFINQIHVLPIVKYYNNKQSDDKGSRKVIVYRVREKSNP